jgi:type I restriction enzyme, S subunit
VKAGYRHTVLGIIPEDWDIRPMREFGKFAKGVGLLKEDIRSSGRIPGIPYTALYTDFSEIVRYDQIKWFVDDPTKTYIVSEPCLLIASSSNMTANTGKASALAGSVSVAIGREVIIFKTPENCRFLSYLLSTPTYRKQTLSLARGTTIKHLYPATFQDYKTALPSHPEQDAIAEALSDVDGLLGGLDRLIAKKRDLKQAAMQQLLTGQTRLLGFHGEWETKQLGNIALCFSGGTPPTEVAAYYSGDIPWITSGDLNKEYITNVDGRISKAGLANSAAQMVEAGTLLIALYGATSGVTAISRIRAAINQAVLAMIPHHDNTTFLYFKLRSIKHSLISTYTQGGQPNLSGNIVKAVELSMPPLPEQTAIAKVLMDMDAELAVLEQRREKTRTLKQAMMQQLLTGRIRLVKPQPAEVTA